MTGIITASKVDEAKEGGNNVHLPVAAYSQDPLQVDDFSSSTLRLYSSLRSSLESFSIMQYKPQGLFIYKDLSSVLHQTWNLIK